jgi:D-sedoheptulose 7-phosphate isomerase
MSKIGGAESYFARLSQMVGRLPFETIDRVSDLLVDAYDNSRMIYVFGNGGSAALASHFVCDLGKGTINSSKKRFRVLALTDNIPLMTAWANDSRYEDIFVEQLANFVREGDVAFAISGSGNSQNVLNALKLARHARATTIGLAGCNGGRMKELCDVCVMVPCDNMQIIEDLHLSIAHALFTTVRGKLSAKDLSKTATQGMYL